MTQKEEIIRCQVCGKVLAMEDVYTAYAPDYKHGGALRQTYAGCYDCSPHKVIREAREKRERAIAEQLQRAVDWKAGAEKRRRDAVARRRGLECNAAGTSYTTAEKVDARCEMWGRTCYLCGAPMQAIDHVIPLTKGGTHWPANLRPICKSCNSKKRDNWPYDITPRRP